MAKGALFYIIGPSGSGKDSLMDYARAHLAGDPGVVFAHRYITRPVAAQGENHIALSELEYKSRLAAGLFAMHWSSHGLWYAIGRELNYWLAKGCRVVVNGSRQYLMEARQHYPELVAVYVKVSPEVLAERLRRRARESQTDIALRQQRALMFNRIDEPVVVLDNDGPLHEAGGRLVELVAGRGTMHRIAI